MEGEGVGRISPLERVPTVHPPARRKGKGSAKERERKPPDAAEEPESSEDVPDEPGDATKGTQLDIRA